MDKKIIFITGSGRCGTKSMCDFYKSKGYYSVHEPEPKMKKEYLLALSKKEYDIYNLMLNKKDKIKKILKNNEFYVESNARLTPFIFLLDTYFDCDIIYLTRDGRDFIRSGMGRKFVTDKLPEPLESIFPKGNYDRFDRMSWLWNYVVSIGLNHYLETRRKDIRRIEDVGRFFNKVNYTKNYSFPHWTEWNSDLKERAKFWINPMLKRLDYIDKEDW